MKIAIDVMGGDYAPLSNIRGAVDYLTQSGNSTSEIVFVGDESRIQIYESTYKNVKDRIHIIHAPDLISPDERSSKIFREKPDSSLVKSVQLVKDGYADAVISAGNTGALLTSALFILGKISGINRPALAPFIPTQSGGFILCDAGANANVKPHHLVQFAIMSQAYLEHLEGRINPKVGLLNIGLEKSKGNELTVAAYPLLEQHVDNFAGNIEARYILDGIVDVVVCDGFVGNSILKAIEGLVKHTFEWLKQNIKAHPISRIGAPLMAPAFNDLKKTLDYEEHGGTSFLGIDGIVIKAHGSSSGRAIKNSLIAAQKAYDEKLIEDITSRMEISIDSMEERNNDQVSVSA